VVQNLRWLSAGDVTCFPHGDAPVLSRAPELLAPPVDLSAYRRPMGVCLPFPHDWT
jgi:hypothetical protein